MSQEIIYNFLKTNTPNRFSAKELMYTLNLTEQTFFNNARRLLKKGEIKKQKGKYWVE